MAARNVITIPQTIDPKTRMAYESLRKRKVAGYARVSTSNEEQITSYKNQVKYYTNYISSNPMWDFVGVYTDEGISGTDTRRRAGFIQMMEDARNGKIDLIITKSISRFSRNTLQCLDAIRELKSMNVEIYFEKEQAYTFDPKGELLISILSSLAQDESRSISENISWTIHRKYQNGEFSLPYKHFLGYEKGEDGLPSVVPEEAAVVIKIYEMYVYGKTPGTIARILTEQGIPTPAGKKKWRDSTVNSILSNEKYKGSAKLQKSFTYDFLEKKKKINEGELPQYYIEHSHEAIISPDVFDEVQAEIERRKAIGKSYSGDSVLSGKIICGDCGDFYGPKVWGSNTKYRKTVWQCNSKFKCSDKPKCTTPHVTEEQIKNSFIRIYNNMILDSKQLIEDAELMIKKVCSFDASELVDLETEIEIVEKMLYEHVKDTASKISNQDAYVSKYDSLHKKYEALCEKIKEVKLQQKKKSDKEKEVRRLITRLSEQNDLLQLFDERIWLTAVNRVVVYHDGTIVFEMKNGMKYEA